MKVYNQEKKAQIVNEVPLNAQVNKIVTDLLQAGWNAEDIPAYISEIMNLQIAIPEIREMARSIEDAKEQTETVQNLMGIPEYNQEEPGMLKTEKTKIFNLKKAQLDFVPSQPPMDDMGLNDTPEMMEPEYPEIQTEQDNLRFQDGADLKDWLDQRDFTSARTELLRYIADLQAQQTIEDALGSFYEGALDRNGKLKLATGMFELLPDNIKQKDTGDESTVFAPYTEACVKETNQIIKNLAEKKFAKKIKIKSFNLKKTAQHKTIDNVLVYGPPEKPIIDPFYRMPVSDWHIIERNKGWGGDIGGIWNIDYETLWRTHIMDKYSRAYKNKDGNWVGGYLNKRFEIDQNIPEGSNYQLKPGQRRKARPVQYGVIEGRLQAARASGEIEGGPDINRSQPFNWKEAQTKKKI